MRRVELLKESIALALRSTMLPVLVREIFQRNKVTIIVYHCISAPLFEKHMKYLFKHYSVISLQQFVEAKYNNSLIQLPKKAAIVTFDDGARNTYALRSIIQKYNIPVTMFVCSDILGTRRHFWFSYMRKVDINLKRIPDDDRLMLLSSVGFDVTKDYDDADSLLMDEVTELLKLGVSFQSHTATHPILPMCDYSKTINEISKSKTDIENLIGSKVTCLAYPNGDYTHRDIDICRESGYLAAVTMEPGFNGKDTDVYRLRRLSIDDHASVNQFAVKISGVWQIVKSIFFRKSQIVPSFHREHVSCEMVGQAGERVESDSVNNKIDVQPYSRHESK